MAWLDPYPGPWTSDEAAHLARRAGFGISPAQAQSLAALGRDSSVSSLVDYNPADTTVDNLIAAQPNTGEWPGIKDPQTLSHLQGRWLCRIVYTQNPLQEQYTLFLHDMITSEWGKIHQDLADRVNPGNDGSRDDQLCGPADLIGLDDPLEPDESRASRWAAKMMQVQNDLLRAIGHGNYATLLKAITRDPAMLVYLDNKDNTRFGVQENYSREIMELFSMGVGNYSEQDVVELAKVFTGETLDDRCERNYPLFYLWDNAIHSTGNKTFLGGTIPYSSTPGQETNLAIDRILQKVTNSGITPAHATLPAACIYIAWRLITWFVGEDIEMDHPAVPELATVLNTNSTNGYRFDMREALRALFRSTLFYDTAYRHNMYRHPVDYVAAPMRILGLTGVAFSGAMRTYLERMGMELYNPPDVNGWDHGRRWIYSSSLIGRFNFANELSKSSVLTNTLCDSLIPTHVASQADEDGIIEYFRSHLIQAPLRTDEVATIKGFFAAVDLAGANATDRYRRKVRGCLHLVMALPRYQLK